MNLSRQLLWEVDRAAGGRDVRKRPGKRERQEQAFARQRGKEGEMRHRLVTVLRTEGQLGARGRAKVSVGKRGHWVPVSYQGGENNRGNVTNEASHRVHPQSVALRLAGRRSPGREARAESNRIKGLLPRHGIARTRGFLLGLTSGVNTKSRSHSLRISDMRLKRASGIFPWQESEPLVPSAGAPSALLLKRPPLPPPNPTVFFLVYS